MRRIPNFAAIKAFEAAARLGSFSAAADELHLSVSAISHQIRNLEATLGVELFKRNPRSVELSIQGRALGGKLTQALDGLESALSLWMPLPGQSSLAVHCSPSFASNWLSPRLPQLMSEPNPLNIRLTSSAVPPELTRHEEIDVAITYGAPVNCLGVISEALGIETIAPMSAPSYLGVTRYLEYETIKPGSLIHSQLSPVTWSDWLVHENIKEVSGMHGLSFDRAALGLLAAADGLGIVLESTRLAENELKKGNLVILNGHKPPLQQEMHFFCYRESMKGSRKIERFRAWLMKQIDLV